MKVAKVTSQKYNAALDQSASERIADLEIANRRLELFSSLVSHDLRAHVRAIGSFSQRLLDESASRLTKRDLHSLHVICHRTGQMRRMIDSFLGLSRTGRQPLSRRLVRMPRLIQEVLDQQSDEIEARRVEICVGPCPDCNGDRTLLKQVWVNLLANALQFTRHKKPAVVELGCRACADGNAYFVRDNGEGFSWRQEARLFDPIKRFPGGTPIGRPGLGLVIAQSVIQRHGGRIWAEGLPRRGATFFFTVEQTRVKNL